MCIYNHIPPGYLIIVVFIVLPVYLSSLLGIQAFFLKDYVYMLRIIEINKLYRVKNIRAENDEEIMELVASIKRNGLLNPVTVKRKGDKYRVIAGHRRFLAMQILKEPFIECNVLEYEPTEKEVLCMQLQENCCRKDMSAWEYVNLFDSLKRQGLTNRDIAHLSGKSESWVTNQYQAVHTLEEKGAVNSETKKLSSGAIRKEFKGFVTRTNTGRKKQDVTCCFNPATYTYSVTISNKKARPEFERFIKEFMKKWQN